MTLNSLTPNAHYDMAHGKPAVIERDNDGSFLYRLNIEPEYGNDDTQNADASGDATEQAENAVQDGGTQIGWMCYETRCWNAVAKNNIERAVIRSVVDECSEFNLVNSYNRHVLGIKVDEQAVEDYKEYLQFTIDLGAQIAEDLANNTID